MEFMAVLAPNQLPSSFEETEQSGEAQDAQDEPAESAVSDEDVQVTGGEA